MSSHIDLAFDRDDALTYQDEVAANETRDNELARLVSWRGEAEDQAAGVRSGGHLQDFQPAGSRLVPNSPAASGAGVGGGETAPAGSSPDDAVTPSSLSPGSHVAGRGAGDESKDEAA